MFNLFKKKETLVLERPNIKNYPKEVLEIHHEFEIASEKLLKSAYEIINSQPVVNTSKVERLKLFGFNQVKEVQESVKIIEATKLSKEQIELVQYYKQNYPFNKFITEPQVKEICHKYNLVCGDVGRFRGFVPEINVKDIENFKLKYKEKDLMTIEAYKDRKSIGIFSAKNIEIKRRREYHHLFIKDKDEYSFQQSDQNLVDNGEFYGTDRSNTFGLRDYGHINIQILNNKLQICAPVKDMDISGLELIEGYKLQKQHIPDPIVLQPVKGGYLIITMWADETFDPYTEPMLRNDEMLN